MCFKICFTDRVSVCFMTCFTICLCMSPDFNRRVSVQPPYRARAMINDTGTGMFHDVFVYRYRYRY
jgi:hypothetical protein